MKRFAGHVYAPPARLLLREDERMTTRGRAPGRESGRESVEEGIFDDHDVGTAGAGAAEAAAVTGRTEGVR